MISPTNRPLPNNTQHSQEKDIYAPARFEPAILACERPQTHALDRVASGISNYASTHSKLLHSYTWTTLMCFTSEVECYRTVYTWNASSNTSTTGNRNKLHRKSQDSDSSISHSKCSQLVCLPGLLQRSKFNILLVSLQRRLVLIWSQGNYVNHRVAFLFVLSSPSWVITN